MRETKGGEQKEHYWKEGTTCTMMIDKAGKKEDGGKIQFNKGGNDTQYVG